MPPQNRSKVPIDTILEGKFRVTKEIGRGGMAAVYEAENIDIGKRVAVKILAAELITSRVVRERFIREARAAAAIRSPYICDVYDSGMFDERPFLVMELLEGESLYDLLTRMRRLSPELTVKITTHTARGLAKAHEANVVHRDLKPENIFLTKNEDGETTAKLLDFGLARFYEPTGGDAAQARLTREGALFGTPAYMSPEQAKGQGEVDHRCDLWALGCIVYECLTGQTVWNVDQGVAMILAQIAGAPLPRPSKLRPDLPPSFDAWFARACDRDPNRRFQSAREFADTLAEALFGPAHAARPQGARAEVPSYLVDSLDALLPPRAEAPPTEPTRSGSVRPAAGAAPPLAQPAPVTVAVPEKRGSGRAILFLFVLGALALGGYTLWLYVLHPPEQTAKPAAAPAGLATLAREPLEKQISMAQEWLSQGKGDAALAALREAYRTNGSGVARSLMSHAGAALEESSGRCRTSGLGRPRPLEATDAASRPALAVSKQGPVVAWVDGRNDPKRRQAFTALLDRSLRRVGDPALVTPEGVSVRLPQLLSTSDGLALVYWEGAGDAPGVYARLLEPNGKIKSPVQRLSATKRSDFYPSMIRNSDGTFWVVWSEQFEPGNEDLVLRKLDRGLSPLTEAIRLTALGRAGRQATTLDKPDLAVQGTKLLIVFVAEKAAQRQIQLLRLDLGDPALARGIPATKDADVPPNLGELVTLNGTPGKYDQPRIGCSPAECVVVWDEEAVGGYAVLLDAKSATPTWERQFGMKGAHPTLAGSGDKQSVAYYDNSRLKLARITRNGLEAGSTLAKVSGLQPFPSLEPGSEPGQWYISWRDYEAGHLEAFVVRAQCQ